MLSHVSRTMVSCSSLLRLSLHGCLPTDVVQWLWYRERGHCPFQSNPIQIEANQSEGVVGGCAYLFFCVWFAGVVVVVGLCVRFIFPPFFFLLLLLLLLLWHGNHTKTEEKPHTPPPQKKKKPGWTTTTTTTDGTKDSSRCCFPTADGRTDKTKNVTTCPCGDEDDASIQTRLDGRKADAKRT